jgi:hypothetical protein
MTSTERPLKNFSSLWNDYSVARDVIESTKSSDSVRMDQLGSRVWKLQLKTNWGRAFDYIYTAIRRRHF